MRTRYLVCYDVSDPKRLRRVAKTCEGYGVRIQFSVFDCLLDGLAFQKLRTRLSDLLKHDEDQVLFVPLGPEGGRNTITLLAVGLPLVAQGKITIV